MIKILLIDDEPLALRQLEMYAAKVADLEVVASCNAAISAMPYLDIADAMFLDINMPDTTGLEFIRSVSNPPLVVFTTAYAQYAVEGFRVNAVDYLLKPFSFKEFEAATGKLRARLQMERAAQALARHDESVCFKTDYKTVKVQLSDIVYIESMSEYVKIHLRGTAAPLVVLYSLKRLSEELPQDMFARIHRSYIVALGDVKEASRTAALLHDGTSLPVGEIFREGFLERFRGFRPVNTGFSGPI